MGDRGDTDSFDFQVTRWSYTAELSSSGVPPEGSDRVLCSGTLGSVLTGPTDRAKEYPLGLSSKGDDFRLPPPPPSLLIATIQDTHNESQTAYLLLNLSYCYTDHRVGHFYLMNSI